jgi:glycosyltransferase involved in cell wall biosynthesis
MHNERLKGCKEKPMISCLCITRNRVMQLRRVIDNFLNQTYPNKELVILFESDDHSTGKLAMTIKEHNVRWHELPSTPKMSLGNLRNLSIELSAGDYFCQWDDDDWYHCERLEMQMNCLLENHKSACLLAYWLIYDSVEEAAYLSHLEPWAGSILCSKGVISETNRYPDLSRHEDSHFIWNCLTLKQFAPLVMPSLYIYVFHGRNTFEREHFQRLFIKSQVLPSHVSSLFKNIFDNTISYADACQLLRENHFLRELDFFHFSKREAVQENESATEASSAYYTRGL